jgi:uncharacterized membrane protein
MSHAQIYICNMLERRKYLIFFVAGIILFIWSIETPPGLLGKTDAIGYAVCHRIDLRSFHIGIRQLPLCARCTGQYTGAMIGIAFQLIIARKRSGFPSNKVLGLFCILLLAFVVDGLNSYLTLPPLIRAFPGIPHLYEPTNRLRLFTGTGMGLVIAAVLYPAFVGSIYTVLDERPAIGSIKILAIMIGISAVVDLLIISGSKYILYPISIISAGGVILLLTMAYTILLLKVFHHENQYVKISQTVMPFTIGFIVTFSQIAVVDLIRFIITHTWSGLVFG